MEPYEKRLMRIGGGINANRPETQGTSMVNYSLVQTAQESQEVAPFLVQDSINFRVPPAEQPFVMDKVVQAPE